MHFSANQVDEFLFDTINGFPCSAILFVQTYLPFWWHNRIFLQMFYSVNEYRYSIYLYIVSHGNEQNHWFKIYEGKTFKRLLPNEICVWIVNNHSPSLIYFNQWNIYSLYWLYSYSLGGTRLLPCLHFYLWNSSVVLSYYYILWKSLKKMQMISSFLHFCILALIFPCPSMVKHTDYQMV